MSQYNYRDIQITKQKNMSRWFWFAKGIGYARTREEMNDKIDDALDKGSFLS